MDLRDAGLAWEILQRYTDPATREFDAVMTAANLPDDVARALRFWQRESVANVKQYAAQALPAVFAAVAEAERDAAEATHRAGSALGVEVAPTAPSRSTWAVPPAPDVVVTLPERSRENARLLEERRRTVAERLRDLG